jgi:hypothetical protein
MGQHTRHYITKVRTPHVQPVVADPPDDYIPKHLKREPRPNLSDYARDKLHDLSICDPWAGEGINRAIQRYHELWDGESTPEDVVNYFSSEIVAMIVVASDMTGPVQDYMECLQELVFNLCEVPRD